MAGHGDLAGAIGFGQAVDMVGAAPARRPVLIAGPTASGKSALALRIAAAHGGVVVNADAMQVYDGWRILTARPDDADLAAVPHALYGHVPFDAAYSAGHWLRDVAPLLGGRRVIVTGGTGLNFAALTDGLADIPATPDEVRARADAMPLSAMIAALDPATAARTDLVNRARVQRAWEVGEATGQSLADWQDATPPALLPAADATALVLDLSPDVLTPRIEARFDAMLDAGLLDEVRAMEPGWDARHASSRAIGAAEMIAHVRGDLPLDAAREAVTIATRQYAKRQRTWFRKRMAGWTRVTPD